MSKLYVQLGKAGDILNLLPLLHLEAQRGEKPGLMVAEEFSGLLDGVSYVTPHIYRAPYHEVGKACEEAKQINGEWTCCQVNCATEAVKQYVYGPAGLKTAVTTSFQKESWRVAGKLASWDDQQPLLFDKRSYARENKLRTEHLTKGKLVLLSLGGVSSPLPLAPIVRELVKAKFPAPKWQVLDLANVKAERFYDLLGLYEKAHCLIATDSGPLHLARATPELPVFALVNDKPLLWNGSPWRPNHHFYCRYGDLPARAGAFVWALDQIGGVGFRAIKSPAIVHIWNEYEGVNRHPDWFDEYQTGHWTMCPIEIGSCGRDSAMILKDPKRLPFLKDALRMGLQRAGDDDLVVLTRPDTRFRSGLTGALLEKSPAFAYRMNQNGGRSTYQPVADLFAASKTWWKKFLPELPDLVLSGDAYWPHALWALFDREKARDLTGMIYRVK